MTVPLFLSIFHYVICLVGTFNNCVLLALILFKTPSKIRSYSILIFSQTLLQFTTCVTSGILFVRLIPFEMTIFVVVNGIGKAFGSHTSVIYFYSIMIHGVVHYSVMLAVCFCYRLYVILYHTACLRTTILIALASYLPTFTVFTWYTQSTFYDPATAKKHLAQLGPSYVFDQGELVTGVANVLEPSVLGAIIWGCGVGAPVYVATILHGLVLQACLPSLYVVACGSYFIGQLNIVQSVVFEYTTHMSGEVIVATSPLLTMYFVKPYRRTLTRLVGRKMTVSAATVSFNDKLSTIKNESVIKNNRATNLF